MILKRCLLLLACQAMLLFSGYAGASELGVAAFHSVLAQQPGITTLSLVLHNPSQVSLSNVVLTETETNLGIKAKSGATPVNMGALAAIGDAATPYVADSQYTTGSDITFAGTATDTAGNPVKFVVTSYAK